MKLLETPSLERISSLLSGERGNSQIDMRLESYSLKMAGTDKKLCKQISTEGMQPRVVHARSLLCHRVHGSTRLFRFLFCFAVLSKISKPHFSQRRGH